MKSFWQGLFNKKEENASINENERQVKILFRKANDYYGNDKFLLKAGKVNALDLMSSDKPEERLTALARILFEEPSIKMGEDNIETRIEKIESRLADLFAERNVEQDIEEQIAERMEKRQREYL